MKNEAKGTQSADRLPKGEFIIGAREIARAARDGKVEKIFIASNCPDKLLSSLEDFEKISFAGDQRELAAQLGKPFPVAMAALRKGKEWQ